MDDRFNRINELYGFYGSLLSQRQQEILQNYYGEDFSLSEIAENLEISRNAVYDALKKAEEKLEEYEGILHLYRDYCFRREMYEKMKLTDDKNIKSLVDELIRYEEEQ